MPVNPPSCHVDVYYSRNVFANKVALALWRPPAGNWNDGTPASGSVGGSTMYNPTEAGIKAHQEHISSFQGHSGPDSDDEGSGTGGALPLSTSSIANVNVSGTSTAPTSNQAGSSKYIQYGDLPNGSTFPDLSDPVYTMQISKYFKLKDILGVPTSEAGHPPAKQIAWNYVLLCQNILDPVRDRYNFKINSGYRSHATNVSKGRSYFSPHEYGIAADIDPGNATQNFELWKYIIRSGLKFNHVIYEWTWVHVAYDGGQQRPQPIQVKTTQNGPPYRKFSMDQIDQAIQFASQFVR